MSWWGENGACMFADLSNVDRGEPTMRAAIAIALIGAAALLGAWFFQYVVGLAPCPLCLEQRVAYYFAIPLAVLIALGVSFSATPKVIQLALLAIALAMLWNAGLGVYHSGIEWKWWPGPQECSGTPSFGTIDELQKRFKQAIIVRCDEAPWRFLGLSLAGYNVLVSLTLAAVAAWGALAKRAAAYGSSSVSQ
jgi:disulfide bond formation protein DsbB